MKELRGGDRVAVYCTPGGVPRRVLGRVIYVVGDEVRFKSDEGGEFSTHRKQCRKLGPKKVRGTWAVVDKSGDYYASISKDEAVQEASEFDENDPDQAPHRAVFLRECKSDE